MNTTLQSLLFCFREYFCRQSVTILYQKHCPTLAMINITKDLPQNTPLVQSEQCSKVPITAPSSGSFLIASEHSCGSIRTYGAVSKSSNDSAILMSESGACLRQHLGHIVSNGQQSAVLHASAVMPF